MKKYKILTKNDKGECGVIQGTGTLNELMKIVKLMGHRVDKIFQIVGGVEHDLEQTILSWVE